MVYGPGIDELRMAGISLEEIRAAMNRARGITKPPATPTPPPAVTSVTLISKQERYILSIDTYKELCGAYKKIWFGAKRKLLSRFLTALVKENSDSSLASQVRQLAAIRRAFLDLPRPEPRYEERGRWVHEPGEVTWTKIGYDNGTLTGPISVGSGPEAYLPTFSEGRTRWSTEVVRVETAEERAYEAACINFLQEYKPLSKSITATLKPLWKMIKGSCPALKQNR